tara:strand:+ start:756 stop:1037 length:282 start_codon:yes stop_codon:yes gene_type:complete
MFYLRRVRTTKVRYWKCYWPHEDEEDSHIHDNLDILTRVVREDMRDRVRVGPVLHNRNGSHTVSSLSKRTTGEEEKAGRVRKLCVYVGGVGVV